MVGHHPVVAEIDVGLSVTNRHPEERPVSSLMCSASTSRICAPAVFGRLAGQEALEEDVEGHDGQRVIWGAGKAVIYRAGCAGIAGVGVKRVRAG